MEIVVPSLARLDGYADALRRGWSADTLRGDVAAREELAQIAADPGAVVAALDNRAGEGSVTLPDGSQVPRLPGFRRWIWDDAFCGSIGFRWQPETAALPPYVPGHIGYAVVPWKQRQGYATRALAQILLEVRREGLEYVTLTTDPDNVPSQKVILANGGTLIGRFTPEPAYGGHAFLRWQITL
jgi:predicted acetyltransferase